MAPGILLNLVIRDVVHPRPRGIVSRPDIHTCASACSHTESRRPALQEFRWSSAVEPLLLEFWKVVVPPTFPSCRTP